MRRYPLAVLGAALLLAGCLGRSPGGDQCVGPWCGDPVPGIPDGSADGTVDPDGTTDVIPDGDAPTDMPVDSDATDGQIMAGPAFVIEPGTGHTAAAQVDVVVGQDANLDVSIAADGKSTTAGAQCTFLVSYKKKLRRFVDQLDVEDVTYDGHQQPLACGNAEVKEMISILRCASFPGYLSLTSRNRNVEDLLQSAKRLEKLLQEM